MSESQNFSDINSLNNLNSFKSKQFQMHTRKLIEIALEMLMKSQVPSVQYISLTTINRIFDIYVYNNLFYPGYYESCYIPLSKRKLNKQKLMQLEIERSQNLKVENENKLAEASLCLDTKSDNTSHLNQLDTPKAKKGSYFFSLKQQINSNRNNKKFCNCELTKAELDNLNFIESSVCCKGGGGGSSSNSANFNNKFSYKLNFEMKDKNSTIKEDPSSMDDMNTLQQFNTNDLDNGNFTICLFSKVNTINVIPPVLGTVFQQKKPRLFGLKKTESSRKIEI